MADTGDLKSPALTGVRVRVPPSAQPCRSMSAGFFADMEKAPKAGDFVFIMVFTLARSSGYLRRPPLFFRSRLKNDLRYDSKQVIMPGGW